MISIFDYDDYIIYLSDYYRENKERNPNFSHRYIGSKVGFSPGYFSRILKRDKKLSDPMIFKFIKFLKLNNSEGFYFENLVKYNQAKTDTEKTKYYERMLSCKQQKKKLIEKDHYELFSQWYHCALHTLINCTPIGEETDFREVGKALIPAVSDVKVKKSIDLLLRLGMIGKNGNGSYEIKNNFISTGENVNALSIRNFLRNSLELAEGALERFSTNKRVASSMVISVSEKGYQKIKEKLEQSRQEINKILATDHDVNRVYQINMQLFPLSHKFQGGSNEAVTRN